MDLKIGGNSGNSENYNYQQNNENFQSSTDTLIIKAKSPSFRSLSDENTENINLDNHLINKYFTQEKADEISKRAHLLKQEDKKFEQEFIAKAIQHIEVDYNPASTVVKNGMVQNKIGSLYSMFDSSFFSMDLMLFYIDKREEVGVIDTLINFMYKNFIHESFFYLPQLCTMLTYKIQTDSLENYILDRCVDQIKFSLKVHWLILSYYENETNPKISRLFDKLLQKIEVTLVNGRRCTASNYSQHNLQKKAILNNETIEIYNNSIDKELRQKYFDKCQDFYQQLKSMCEKLKNFPKESNRPNNRNAILKDYIFMYNLNLDNLKIEMGLEKDHSSIVKNFYKGIILPFDDSYSTLDEHNSIIVRIIPDYAFCFSTKARVPVKLSVECIRVIECCKWEELYINEEKQQNIEDKFKSKEAFDLKLKNTLQMQQDNEFLLVDNNFSQSKMTKSLNDFMNEVKLNKTKEDSVFNSMSFKQKEKDDMVVIDFNPDVINPFGKKWTEVCLEIKEKSPFRKFETYSIKNFIAKANDDLRQELMTMQLIKKFDEIFTSAEISLKIRPYEILITSSSSGLIEFLPNTNSIDGVKKKLPPKWNLNSFYRNFFSDHFEEAQKNFAESLAAYSLLAYFIQIKDRHNGNILIDMKGHIIHIDFGFILGINPGNVNFESAPFKLTSEYVEILDGMDSPIFEYYKSLILRGFMEAKKHVNSLCKVIEIMSRGSKMPCFENTDINLVISKFRERFYELSSETSLKKIVDDLINTSYNNFWTNKYDYYQKLTNDILP